MAFPLTYIMQSTNVHFTLTMHRNARGSEEKGAHNSFINPSFNSYLRQISRVLSTGPGAWETVGSMPSLSFVELTV